MELARATVADRNGRTRGAHHRAEAAEMIDAWSSVVAKHPSNEGVRLRLVRHLAAIGSFREARVASWPCAPADAVDAALDPAVAIGLANEAPANWLYSAYAQLVTEGFVVAAVDLKQQLAQRVTRTKTPWHGQVDHLIRSVQAASYVDGPGAAMRRLRDVSIVLPTAVETAVLAKFRSDLYLARGDSSHHCRQRTIAPTPTPTAERRLVDWLRGSNILVVGPAQTGRPSHDDLRWADVVVSTKRTLQLDQNLRQVVYLADASMKLDPVTPSTSVIRVVRPSIIAFNDHILASNPDLRVMPSENSNNFLGTHFAIQRILYDLVAYSPSGIRLAGCDFFLSTSPYLTGYANEVDDIFEPLGLQPVVFAPHDHLWDFRFVQALRAHRMISAVPEVDALLDMTPAAYLERLETARRSITTT